MSRNSPDTCLLKGDLTYSSHELLKHILERVSCLQTPCRRRLCQPGRNRLGSVTTPFPTEHCSSAHECSHSRLPTSTTVVPFFLKDQPFRNSPFRLPFMLCPSRSCTSRRRAFGDLSRLQKPESLWPLEPKFQNQHPGILNNEF